MSCPQYGFIVYIKTFLLYMHFCMDYHTASVLVVWYDDDNEYFVCYIVLSIFSFVVTLTLHDFEA